MKPIVPVLAALALAGCSDRPPVADGPAPAQGNSGSSEAPAAPAPMPPATPDASPSMPDSVKVEADYLGRWTGVEGMYLLVAPKPGGGVTLEMQWDLDNTGTFDGSVTAEGLRFMRNGEAQSAVHTDGDATGLKNLAGKQDCLTVKPGEGYCRD